MLRSSFLLACVWTVVGCSSDEAEHAGGGQGGSAGQAGGAGSSGSAQGGSGGAGSGGTGSSGKGGGAGKGGASGAAGSTAGSAGTQAGSGGDGQSGAGAGDGGGGTDSGGAGAAGTASGNAGQAGTGGGSTGTPVVYVGGYSRGSETFPFTTYDLDKETGSLTPRSETADAGQSPAYIAAAPSGRFLYVANESDDASGGLTALAIGDDGTLTRLNHQTGSDGGLVFVAITPNGEYALGASYNGGSVSVFPIMSDGSLGPELDNVDMGEDSQSHAIGLDPSGQHVFVPNKGNDEVAQLLIGEDGMLSPNTPSEVASATGAGPRHIAVHPNGTLAFVINELDSTMTPYTLTSSGLLTAGTSLSTLPSNFNGQNSGAHVELSPDGRFVYGSNRGHDSIVVFSADQTSGALTLVEHEPTRGDVPRDFEMDPAGDILIVANQNSDTLSVFAVGADGALSPLGGTVAAPPEPAAVQIVYLP